MAFMPAAQEHPVVGGVGLFLVLLEPAIAHVSGQALQAGSVVGEMPELDLLGGPSQ